MHGKRLVLLFAMLSQACGGALISNQQELEIGVAVDKQLKGEYRLVDSRDPVAKWAKQLVKPLQKASARFRNPKEIRGYKVAVIADNKLINAFAAPGGYTYLSTGLILKSKTCAEIAGVMGHELAHVTQRHGAKSIEKAFAMEQIISFFLDDGLAAGTATLIWQFLSSTTFSRDDETEADRVGLQIAYDAGYDPDGLVDFFSVLLKQEKGGSVPEFLSSHPATKGRIKAVQQQINRRYGKPKKGKTLGSRECLTTLSLAEVKKRIKSGKLRLGPKATKPRKSRAESRKSWRRSIERFEKRQAAGGKATPKKKRKAKKVNWKDAWKQPKD